jgi:hypothetical protein
MVMTSISDEAAHAGRVCARRSGLSGVTAQRAESSAHF